MSLIVALPCAIASACAYGVSNAVQHSAAHTGTGQADTKRLVGLLRNPRWLASVAGDSVGLLLQVIALATGPVVLVSPLLVLSVPMSLFVGTRLGGPRPDRADYLASVAILVGLGVFTALVGDPGEAHRVHTRQLLAVTVIALILAGLACTAVRRAAPNVRAGVYGAVSGTGFGLVAVLVNSAAHAFHRGGLIGDGHHSPKAAMPDGMHGMQTHAAGLLSYQGLMPVVGAIVVGASSMVILQIAFQVGSLAASFPANEAAAPLVAVTLGTLLLHQNLPRSPGHVVAYLACYALVVAGTIRLGQRQART